MSDKPIKRIGVYTSGGDAPGMNAALRAVVRTGIFRGLDVYGIYSGYEGMINDDIKKLNVRDVGNIIQRGGTFLKTARSMEFMTPEGRKKAHASLKRHKIQALVALGGNGTFTGAQVFHEEYGIPVVGVPCTIDNDLYGTDVTIGFDTAVNTAIDAVDKIRDTAESHNRVFFIEVMGRNSGYIALYTAIGSGATTVLLPERETSMEELVRILNQEAVKNKAFSLVVVAEGNKLGKTQDIAEEVKQRLKLEEDVRVTVVGHMQRGGSPSGFDRLVATRLGNAAVEAILQGYKNAMAGISNNQLKHTPLSIAIKNEKEINMDLLRMIEMLAV